MTSLPISILQMFISFSAGILTAMIYLALLWWTISSLKKARYKGLLLTSSAIIRLGLLVLISFLCCSQGNTICFLCAVFSFILTRLVIVNFVRLRRAA